MSPTYNTIGRPPKFAEARRPVTVTLPERTLRQLETIDADRARAIVKATEASLRGKDGDGPLVATVDVAKGQAMIVVGPSRSLRAIPWLRMVEIAPARHLLAIPSGTAVDSLEVAILDKAESEAVDDPYERTLLMELYAVLRSCRQRQSLSKAEILFVSPMAQTDARAAKTKDAKS